MATRKTKLATSARGAEIDAARASAVVLEQIHADFKVFGEALAGVREKLDHELAGVHHELATLHHKVDTGFAGVTRQLAEVDRRFDRVDRDIADIRTDITDIRTDITDIRIDVSFLKIAVIDHSRQLKEVRIAVDKKIDRDDVTAIVESLTAPTRG